MNYQETLQRLLQVMVDKSASDLFITTNFPPALKLNGQFHTLGSQQLSEYDVSQFAEAMTTEQQKEVFSASRELNFAYATESLGRFRVNIMLQKGHGAMVLRRIPSRIETADELSLPPVLKTIALEKRGLVLVVGFTGSGKSTTLASMVDHRNRHSAGHIITIEDPIEFIHDHQKSVVHQREIGMDTASWQAALKNILRQSPDVIMIGEIRDRETMEQAIAFAETGHLCLATLSSNNASQALDRLINLFPTDRRHQLLHDLSLNLKAVVSQRLIPRQDQEGRVPAVEVLVQSPFVSDLIARGEIAGLKDLMEKDLQFGMQTFDQSLCDLEAAGKISEQIAVGHADSANNLRLKIQLRNRQAVIRDELDNPSMFSVLE